MQVRWIKHSFSDGRFYTKLVGVLLILTILVLWRVPVKGTTGMIGVSQECLWAYTVPGYFLLLLAIVVASFFGETQDNWFHHLFILSGVILFTATGAVTLYNVFFYDRNRLNTLDAEMTGLPPRATAEQEFVNLEEEHDTSTYPTAIGILCLVVVGIFLFDSFLTAGYCKCLVKVKQKDVLYEALKTKAREERRAKREKARKERREALKEKSPNEDAKRKPEESEALDTNVNT